MSAHEWARMTMYHVTHPDAARRIDSDGAFRDGRPTLFNGVLRKGVWISDVIVKELFDVVVVYAIDIDLEPVADYECTDGVHDYRQWVVPAEILNRVPRRRIT